MNPWWCDGVWAAVFWGKQLHRKKSHKEDSLVAVVKKKKWQKAQSQLTDSFIERMSGTTLVWNMKDNVVKNQTR